MLSDSTIVKLYRKRKPFALTGKTQVNRRSRRIAQVDHRERMQKRMSSHKLAREKPPKVAYEVYKPNDMLYVTVISLVRSPPVEQRGSNYTPDVVTEWLFTRADLNVLAVDHTSERYDYKTARRVNAFLEVLSLSPIPSELVKTICSVKSVIQTMAARADKCKLKLSVYDPHGQSLCGCCPRKKLTFPLAKTYKGPYFSFQQANQARIDRGEKVGSHYLSTVLSNFHPEDAMESMRRLAPDEVIEFVGLQFPHLSKKDENERSVGLGLFWAPFSD
jgi:hypothetical protein